jgi:ActR/RegA family two-component response regulator
MPLQAFLLCADPDTVKILAMELAKLDFAIEQARSPVEAFERLSQNRFDLIIVDDLDSESTALVLHGVRTGENNKRSFVIAVADPESTGVKAFRSMGANLLMYRPITPDRAATSLQSAVEVLKHERRRSLRLPAEITVSVSGDGTDGTQVTHATIEDCSEGGVALRTADLLQLGGPLRLVFTLPHSPEPLELTGELVWKDAYGRSGIRFIGIPESVRQTISDWLRSLGCATGS